MKIKFLQVLKRYKLIFTFSIFMVSCGKKEEGESISADAAGLEKLDSVEVSFRGQLTVHDLDPLQKMVLFVSQEKQTQIVLADFGGQVRASFPREEILPDGHEGLLAPFKINGKDSFLAYGPNEFMTFDFLGRLQSTVGHSNPRPADVQSLALGEGMEKFGDRLLFTNLGFGNMDQRGTDSRREMRLLAWLSPETGETEPFLQFPESSIFRQGGSFFKDAWKPAFTVVDDLIFVVFGIEPVIYAYNASPPYSPVSTIPIELPGYRYFQESDSRSDRLDYFELPFTSGRILNIKRVGGHFMIAYFPGFDLRDSKEYASGKSTRELISLGREMRREYPARIAIVDSLGKTVGGFAPKDLDPESMVLRNDELWMQEKPDEEGGQDYFRLFRMGLKFD